MCWSLKKSNSKRENDAQSGSTRLALIRRAVQQLPVQNPLVESRFRGGGEGATEYARGKPLVFEFFKTREVTETLQAVI